MISDLTRCVLCCVCRQEYMRYVLLVEALQAALNCVASLPGMPPPQTSDTREREPGLDAVH
jgi:hypothetical protein